MNRRFSSHKLCFFVKIALDSTCKCINLSLFWGLITFFLLLILNKVFSLHQINKKTVKMQSRNGANPKLFANPCSIRLYLLYPFLNYLVFPGVWLAEISAQKLFLFPTTHKTFLSLFEDPFHTIPCLIPIMYHPFATCYTHKATFNLF